VGTAEKSAEKAGVESIEHFFQVVEMTLRAGVALAAASMANEFCLTADGGAGGKSLETQVLRRLDGLAVEFGEQNVRNRTYNALRRAFNKVGEADKYLAFA